MILTQIDKEIVSAMKGKDPQRVNSLRYAKSLLLENAKSVKPREQLDVLLSYKKTLEKSLETYSSHPEEQKKINYDISVLSEYLPKQMTEEEVKTAILEIKNSKNISDFSVLMKESMATLKGKVDGKLVSSLVKQVLS